MFGLGDLILRCLPVSKKMITKYLFVYLKSNTSTKPLFVGVVVVLHFKNGILCGTLRFNKTRDMQFVRLIEDMFSRHMYGYRDCYVFQS